MIKHFDRRHLLKRLGCLTFSPLTSALAMEPVLDGSDFGTVKADLLAVLEYGVPLQIEWHDMFDTLALCGDSPSVVSIVMNSAGIEQSMPPALAARIRELVSGKDQSFVAAVVVIRGSKKALSIPRCKAVFNTATYAFESTNGRRTQMLFGIAQDETVADGLRVTVVAGTSDDSRPINATENDVIPSIDRCWVPSSPRLPDV